MKYLIILSLVINFSIILSNYIGIGFEIHGKLYSNINYYALQSKKKLIENEQLLDNFTKASLLNEGINQLHITNIKAMKELINDGFFEICINHSISCTLKRRLILNH